MHQALERLESSQDFSSQSTFYGRSPECECVIASGFGDPAGRCFPSSPGRGFACVHEDWAFELWQDPASPELLQMRLGQK